MGSDPKISPAEVEHAASRDMTSSEQQRDDARNATSREHNLTLRESFRLYPKAIGFSILFSAAIIMEGYDLSLMGAFYGYDSFQERYGNESDGQGGKVISADWQTYIQVGGMCGQIIGLYLNGWISDAIGYKRTMIGSQVLMIAGIFIPFFAKNLEMLLAGAILLGVPWGVFQTLTIAYASDIAPVVLRPYLSSFVNLCWVFGQLIAAGVLRGLFSMKGEWSYRIPFALQWIWPPFIILGTIFAPESPWWLVRQGRLDDARRAISSLVSQGSGIDFDVDDQVAMLKATNELEKEHSAGMNYWHCFMRKDLRRTEIASVSYTAQALVGSVLMGYSVQFYERAGLSADNSFTFNVIQYAVGAVGVMCAWFLMSRFGRRTMYLGGVSGLLTVLLVIGGLGFANPALSGPSWAIGSLLIFYTFLYNSSVGPLCYTIVAEIPSTRLKAKTIVLARNFNNMAGIINNFLMPRMIGVNSWNWGAKTGFFWAGWCLLILTWAYFRLPETKGRTYGELDVLFEQEVSARKFASTRVDQFADAQHIEKMEE
ncbi:general alpha-glucoside permease [Plectosphaerella cucumerina]|uniref:General alpha-glucoside permease n=1 Tax=Plectosphaerella cucumerina TaxID=40658 RepID=A0A8K0T5M6_9PEZI|nr:general alpha-glucoside permease [Plectosphaerella cucumerina]